MKFRLLNCYYNVLLTFYLQCLAMDGLKTTWECNFLLIQIGQNDALHFLDICILSSSFLFAWIEVVDYNS